MKNHFVHTKSSLAILALLASLTACGGSGGSSDSYGSGNNTGNNSGTNPDNSNNTPTTPADSTAQASAPTVLNTVIGDVLVTAANRTLYTFANDTQNNVSTCIGECAQTWPPLLASSSATASAPFAIFTRADGSRQWSLKGDPLYRFRGDSEAGQVNGENIGGVWHAGRLDPVLVSEAQIIASGEVQTPNGRLARNGFTLYTFANDTAGVSNCTGNCAQTWPPLLADAGAKAEAPFNLIARGDDVLQWAFNNQPLYLFSGDVAAGDSNGEGIGNVWFSARVAPVAVITATSQRRVFAVRGAISDGAGNLTSAKQGFVVYTFDEDSTNTSTCFNACADTWPPLYAQSSDVATGDFSIVDRNENGAVKKQWALRGEPLYFYVGDQAAGETNGVFGTWRAAQP